MAAAGAILLAACGGRDDGELSRGLQTTVAPVTVSTTVAPPPTTPLTTVAPGPPVAAATPTELAAQLLAVETAIRNPGTPAAELPRLAHTQQVATVALSKRPEWQAEVYAALPSAIRSIVEGHVRAAVDLRVLASDSPPDIPNWRIVSPPPAATLLAEYRSAEANTGVPWEYLAAIHLVESRMGRIRGDSHAGAQGPMQFLPSTWAAYGAGGDINSYHDAIMAAARYLKANGAPGDMANAVFNYNHSNRYVRAVTTYAENMKADERAYLGYYHWQVYYFDTWLPEGYGS